jgi:hypothetical protein
VLRGAGLLGDRVTRGGCPANHAVTSHVRRGAVAQVRVSVRMDWAHDDVWREQVAVVVLVCMIEHCGLHSFVK